MSDYITDVIKLLHPHQEVPEQRRFSRRLLTWKKQLGPCICTTTLLSLWREDGRNIHCELPLPCSATGKICL